MAIVINGNGTVTGLAVGGLPDDTVDAGTLASGINKTSITDGGNATAITIDSSERVGVGATSLNRKLTILTTNQTDVAITAANNQYAQLCFGDPEDDNIGVLGYNNSDNSMSFTTNTTAQLKITSDGRGLSQFTAKFWALVRSAPSTPVFRDSHNCSSITDHAVGDITVNLTVDMGQADYAVVASGGSATSNPSDKSVATVPVDAGAVRLEIYNMGGTHHDLEYISVIGFGD